MCGSLFDDAYYLATYPDVAAAGMEPLSHYLERGAAEGRRPNPLFDSAYYLASNPDVAASGMNPLEHYLRSGFREGRRPNPLFDSAYYLASNPEVAASGVNPLVHYLEEGSRAGRDPSPLFSTSFYLTRYQDVAEAGVNPLAHFLARGVHEGRQPGPVPLSEQLRRLMREGASELACELYSFSCAPVPAGEAPTVTLAVRVRSLLDELRQRGTLSQGASGATTRLEAPALFGADLQPRGGVAHLPPEYVGVLENVSVVGGTRLILGADDVLLHDELAQVTYGGDYGVKTPRQVPLLEGDSALLRVKRKEGAWLDAGVLLSCDHDNNYFHWLVECLPKLAFINTHPELDKLPLLIGQELHPNLLRALEVLNQGRRPVIRLEDGYLYQVRRLVVPSDLSRILDRYEGTPVAERDCVLSPTWVRRTARLLGEPLGAATDRPWRKLYLTRRNAGYRKVRNEHELELMLIEQGFEVVDLEGASFESQVALFRQASLVIAPTGAAVTNLLFCQPGTRAIVLSSDHASSNFHLFSQLARVMDVRFAYVLGRRMHNLSAYTVHDDYVIDVELLREVMAAPEKGIVHAAS
jgi:capsular polysaccharide biosynthesis protein